MWSLALTDFIWRGWGVLYAFPADLHLSQTKRILKSNLQERHFDITLKTADQQDRFCFVFGSDWTKFDV